MFKSKLLIGLFGTILLALGNNIYTSNLVADDITLNGFYESNTYIDSNRYTHLKSTELAENQIDIYENLEIINTELGIIYIDTESLAFQYQNENGYIWSSMIDYINEDLPMSAITSMRSALNIESYNTDNNNYTVTRENLFTIGTTINFTEIEDGFSADVVFGISKIKMTLIVLFKQDEIIVKIPNNSIEEDGRYKIKSVKVYKDFGSVKDNNIPGYMFVPDGIGALIDYKEDKLGVPNYSKSIYGNSLGYNTFEYLNDYDENGYPIYVPVFGFVHGVNQQAVFANITSGSEFGNINVYYPSKNRGYSTIFPSFTYRSTYNQPVDQLGNTITLLQDFRNEVDVEISYNLLLNDDANYVGMAINYRDYLMDNNVEVKSNSSEMPLQITFIGGERKESILFDKHVKMTTLDDILDITYDIKENITPNIVLTIDGFTSDGMTYEGPKYNDIARWFGSKQEISNLENQVNTLYLAVNNVMGNSKNGGYNAFTDLAKKINNELYAYQTITSEMYLLEHQKVINSFDETYNNLNEYNVDAFAYKYFGNILYDDFKNESYINQYISIIQDLLSKNNTKIALYQPNAYLYEYIDSYFDFPMYSSQFISFDDTIPFISIALSNLVDLYSPYANFLPQNRDDLLRMIDFHIYPSFIITQNSSSLLNDTALEYIYSSKYDSLALAIKTYYEFCNEALASTINAQIISRDVLIDGVIQINYSNDKTIIVNYTNEEYIYLNHQVLPKSYYVGDTL